MPTASRFVTGRQPRGSRTGSQRSYTNIGSSAVAGFPADTTLSYIATPVAANPSYLGTYTDPDFGTLIKRITDTAWIGHYYSRAQAWNSDSTLLLLKAVGAATASWVVDGTTYAKLQTTASPPADAQWSRTNPNRAYGGAGTTFHYRDYPGWGQTTIRDFSATYTSIDGIGSGDGILSYDDRYVALVGSRSGADDVFVYDITGDTVKGTAAFTSGNIVGATMTPSGAYVVVQFLATGSGAAKGTWLYDSTMTAIRQLTTVNNHADVGYAENGTSDQFVQTVSGNVTAYNLAANTSVNLFAAGTAMGQCHISMRCESLPGWAMVSVFDESQTGLAGNDELVLVKTDGSQTVRRFGHEHSKWATTEYRPAGSAPDSNKRYSAEAQASISRDGKRVIFRSLWGDATASGVVYCYVAGVSP